jgi:hypothetical protein
MLRYLKKKKISHDLILVTPRRIYEVKDVVLRDDFDFVIRVSTSKPFYIGDFDRYSYYNEVSLSYQGANAYAVNMLQKAKRRTIEKVMIPVASTETNCDQTDIPITIDPAQEGPLLVKRKVSSKGLNRFPQMNMALTPYEYLYDCKPDKYFIKLV